MCIKTFIVIIKLILCDSLIFITLYRGNTVLFLSIITLKTNVVLLCMCRTFNMDEFKRVYSNEDESVSIKYFWDKFDPEHYSIWYCDYLYPQELTLTFMSCNLIGGKLI